jgi:hypothetical protein
MRRIILPLLVSTAFLVASNCLVFAEESSTSGGEIKLPIERKSPPAILKIERKLEEKRGDQLAFAQIPRDEIRERIATKTAQLKIRLEAFRDQRKAAITERISDNLNKINTQRTEQSLKHLDKMTEILMRLEKRVAQSSSSADKTPTNNAISLAKDKIATASQSAMLQSEKDYTLTATEEGKIREEAKTKRDMLHADLKALLLKVQDAKKAVANAIETAATTLGGKK